MQKLLKHKAQKLLGIKPNHNAAVNPVLVGSLIASALGASYFAMKQYDKVKDDIQVRLDSVKQQVGIDNIRSIIPTSIKEGIEVEEIEEPKENKDDTIKKEQHNEDIIEKKKESEQIEDENDPIKNTVNENINEDLKETLTDKTNEQVSNVRDMLKNLNQAIIDKDYISFIKLSAAMPQLFGDINLFNSETVFDEIEKSNTKSILKSILDNQTPEITHYELNTPHKVENYNNKVISSKTGDIIILNSSLSLLQAACTRPVTESDFKSDDISNFMAIKLEDCKMLMLMLKEE